MFRKHQDLIEGMQSLTANDPDREVESIITRKKSIVLPPPGTIEYQVSGNESLPSIAAKHKSTTSELIKINKLMSTLIFPGQKLYVPTEDYVPIRYGSLAPSPCSSPKLRSGSVDPRSGSIDPIELLKQRRKSLDDSKKSKKPKNRTKEDRRPSDVSILPKRKKSFTGQRDSAVFIARVDYVTGEKDPYVSGLLQITSTEVNFEPDVMENDRDLLKDLVQYRMSLGKAMIAANIVGKNPYTKIQETVDNRKSKQSATENGTKEANHDSSQPNKKGARSERKNSDKGGTEDKKSEGKRRSSGDKASDFWSDYESGQNAISFGSTTRAENGEHEENSKENDQLTENNLNHETNTKDNATSSPDLMSSSPRSSSSLSSPEPVQYLLVKLGIPSKAVKERPTISSLIRGSLPVNETVAVDHCFVIPNDAVDRLTDFLQTNYPQAYGKTDLQNLERFDSIDAVIRQPNSKNSRQFLRTLSVAELCNLPLPEMSDESSILTETHIRILREHLLTSADGRPWSLVYSSNNNGYSINTLYRTMIKTDETTLLVVADMENKVFGAMMPNSIRQSEGFYGNGETFLFTFHPIFKKFSWTGKNCYFLKGDPTSFYIGASDGVSALWLHDDLDHGRTQRCDTFDNDLLTENSEDFNIRCIEVWQFPFSL